MLSFYLLNLSLYISVFMGPIEIPSQSAEAVKVPTAHYEFGANYIDPKVGNHHNVYFETILLILRGPGNYLVSQDSIK